MITIKYYRYSQPFWRPPPLSLNSEGNRLGYIGRERDAESLLGDHGVRKYDYETGRFTSVDPLWEKYAGWEQYQYAGNKIQSD